HARRARARPAAALGPGTRRGLVRNRVPARGLPRGLGAVPRLARRGAAGALRPGSPAGDPGGCGRAGSVSRRGDRGDRGDHLAVELGARLHAAAGERGHGERAGPAHDDQPLRGTGAATFDLTHRLLRTDAVVATEPHSVPLQLLSETGIVGALL